MDQELYGYEAERERLRRQWQANEAELQRLADLPTGTADPAAREKQIDAEQDQIEGAVGELYLKERSEDGRTPPHDPDHLF